MPHLTSSPTRLAPDGPRSAPYHRPEDVLRAVQQPLGTGWTGGTRGRATVGGEGARVKNM